MLQTSHVKNNRMRDLFVNKIEISSNVHMQIRPPVLVLLVSIHLTEMLSSSCNQV